MKKNTEQILQELAELQERFEGELASFAMGDYVTFNAEGEDLVGVVENMEDDVYTVRVMAEHGGEFEPTDDVRSVAAPVLSAYTNDIIGEPDEPANEPANEPAEDDDDELEKGDTVRFRSKAGITYGIVRNAKQKATVEVCVRQKDGTYLPTGVTVTHAYENLTKSAVEIEKPKQTILAKIKAVKMEDDEQKETGEIEGILSSYGNVDLGGDTIAKGAYTQTLKHKGGKVKFFFDHYYGVKDVAGVAYLEDKEDGLHMRAVMPLKASDVRDAFEKTKFMIEHGEPLGLSIGYEDIKSTIDPNGIRTLKEIALHEASLTPFPMDTYAQTYNAKARRMSYMAKRELWQQIEPDAPKGSQYTEGELTSLLGELRTIIQND